MDNNNMNKEYVTILDFEAGRVFQYEVHLQEEELIEFMEEKGHNLSNCEWMIHQNPQIIID